MTRIYFCKIPFLDVDYANVLSFTNQTTRRHYFLSKSTLNFEINLRKGISTSDISVPYTLSSISQYDYLFFNYGGKDYFYFITGKDQINESNTIIYISKDVFTTHQFDVEYLDSFIDRCHVNRWNGNKPTRNTVEEGLDFGENIQTSEPQVVTEFSDSVIMASSVPMGRLQSSDTSGGGGKGKCWEEGKPSPKGFRFIKGFEGIGYKPYQDSGGYWTIGYGVTLHGEPDIYNEFVSLSNSGKLTEEVCAKKSYDLKVQRYGLKILDSVKALGCNNQGQFDALLSLAFNSGNGSITGSNSLTNAIKLNPNDESTIRPIWENFKITSGGQVLQGLKLRRIQECNMYFGKEVEIRKISIVSGGSGYVTENNGDGWLPPECSTSGEGEGDYNGYKSFNNAFGNGWLCPVKGGTVTSKYGWRKHPISGQTKFHKGTDISNPEGAPTVASKSGVVIFAGWNDQGFGNLVILNHDNKYKSYYPHLSEINVKIGDTVERGQVVGLIGSTGDSTGSHCHWEIRDYNTNESTDPAPSLQKGDKV